MILFGRRRYTAAKATPRMLSKKLKAASTFSAGYAGAVHFAVSAALALTGALTRRCSGPPIIARAAIAQGCSPVVHRR